MNNLETEKIMAKREIKYDTYSPVDALSVAFGIVTELAEELQNWYDNMPENMQQGDKASSIEEAAQTLEGVSEVELPDVVKNDDVYTAEVLSHRPLGRRASRSDRRSYAVGLLQDVRDTLDAHVHGDEERDADLVSEADDVIGELDSAIGELEGVKFPGMY